MSRATKTEKVFRAVSLGWIGETVKCPSCHGESEILRRTHLGQYYSGSETELRCGHIITVWFQ